MSPSEHNLRAAGKVAQEIPEAQKKGRAPWHMPISHFLGRADEAAANIVLAGTRPLFGCDNGKTIMVSSAPIDT